MRRQSLLRQAQSQRGVGVRGHDDVRPGGRPQEERQRRKTSGRYTADLDLNCCNLITLTISLADERAGDEDLRANHAAAAAEIPAEVAGQTHSSSTGFIGDPTEFEQDASILQLHG